MRQNKTQGIYGYLEPFLERGNQEEIQEAKKRYYRKYKADWRRKHRQEQKEYTISLKKSERKEIHDAAKRSNLSITQFIKQAALCTSRSELFVFDKEVLQRIEALLTSNYCVLERIEEQLDDGIRPSDLLEEFSNLEQQIRNTLKMTLLSS